MHRNVPRLFGHTITVALLLALLLSAARTGAAPHADPPWSTPERIDAGPEHRSWPDIAVDDQSNAYVVWQGGQENGSYIYFSYRPVDGTWTPGSSIDNRTTEAQYCPSIAVDKAGNAHAIWLDDRDDGNIYASYRPAGDQWEPSIKVNDHTGYAGMPAIAVDGAGNAYAVFMDWRNEPSPWELSGEYLGDADIYFSYRPKDGAWSPNVRVSSSVTS